MELAIFPLWASRMVLFVQPKWAYFLKKKVQKIGIGLDLVGSLDVAVF